MRKLIMLAAGLLAMLAAPAFAQAPVATTKMKFLIAAASSSGTYLDMLKQIEAVCDGDDYEIVEADVHGGATDNLAALVNNKVNAAFLHSDVIYFYAQSEPKYRDYKTLVALYPEDIHVLTLRTSKVKTGGVLGVGAKTVEFHTLADLAGFKVGAAGGGVITSRILAGQGEGKFEVVPFDSGKDVIPALDRGDIQAAIFVGGAPLPNLISLTAAQYKLLPIGEAIGSRLSGVYRPTTINYVNLQSDNIKTLAPMATLVTRKYTTPKFVAPQARFRSCFYDKLSELQETTGNHPKWQVVDPADHGVWEWYEFPAKP